MCVCVCVCVCVHVCVCECIRVHVFMFHVYATLPDYTYIIIISNAGRATETMWSTIKFNMVLFSLISNFSV